MIKDEFIGLCMEVTREILENNKEEFAKNLFVGCTKDDSYEEVYGKMFVNAINISVQASVQTIMDIFCESGIISKEAMAAYKYRPPVHLVKDDDKR